MLCHIRITSMCILYKQTKEIKLLETSFKKINVYIGCFHEVYHKFTMANVNKNHVFSSAALNFVFSNYIHRTSQLRTFTEQYIS